MDNDEAVKLVAEVLAGHRESFAELLREYQGPIYNLALRLTGGSTDQAADLSQEIFTRAWLKLPAYDSARPFFTWLYSLALNVIRNHLARNRRRPPASGPEADRLADERRDLDPQDALQRRREQAELLAVLQRLPLEQREVLLLRYYKEIIFPDLAVILGISESAAKMRASRGLAALRQLLARAKKM